MEKPTMEEIVQKLGNLTVLEIIALTKDLEAKWGVKAEPPTVEVQHNKQEDKVAVQTEFNVFLASVPSDKKMPVIKAVRELLGLGLKESKELVEAAPKMIKEAASKEEADELKAKLTEAGAVIEVK